ncbi:MULTISPECIES: hypothetical protein [Sulfitobacter]|jgi:hypothetical protein|uniref:hypothetical protein n=1 Tax=Sulfitobacter TaxID=60136 RepID=UPI0007C33E66|nr:MULTISPECIES: hypothetical protein [Sulfitobacter]KZY52409.1 hypothetical protein A3734_00180 [Sulfitobacter sp. HI0054]MBO9438632.1 hypothetical protein [Sulfitobacter sp. R18_2]MDH4539983.1 hypothetical protein [Sulfitobacter faviae]TKA84091.1 hypothetical protein FCK22_17830 [Sulfitobacter sp. 15WGC]
MIDNLGLAMATVREATKPKRSGHYKNSHEIRSLSEPVPDYEKMKKLIEGSDTAEKISEQAAA